ncbi:MAG: hypothetical protein WBD95_09920, partial [Xanthobacteraceae bacterium]
GHGAAVRDAEFCRDGLGQTFGAAGSDCADEVETDAVEKSADRLPAGRVTGTSAEFTDIGAGEASVNLVAFAGMLGSLAN